MSNCKNCKWWKEDFVLLNKAIGHCRLNGLRREDESCHEHEEKTNENHA